MRSADASDVPRGKHTVSAHAPGCRRRAKHQSWSHTQAGMRSPRSLRPTPWRSRFLSPSAWRCGGLPASPGDAFALLGPSRALRFSAVPFGVGAAREEDGCACSGFALGSCECRLFRVPSARVVRRLDASPAVAAFRRRAVRRDMAAVGADGAVGGS